MRTIVVLFFTVLSFNVAVGQTMPIDNLFDKYAYKDGFTTVFISKYMFGLFSKKEMAKEDSEEIQNAISGLESIRILTTDDDFDSSINFFEEVAGEIPFSDYKPLMVVKEDDQELRMLIKEEDGLISEFLMLGGGKDNVLISILGRIDLNSIAKISEAIDVEGLQKLEELEEKK